MNNKKICFISCVNDDIQYEECLLYINNLNIPEGYKIDAISIKESESMTAAYNAAMKDTDAKYKVYLHQDTLIINKNFIYDILRILNTDDNVGMIGVVGSKTIPTNGIWWDSIHKYGKVYDSHTGVMDLINFNELTNDYEEVKAIDGLIMITQYDLPWREDIFSGWHFYDISQSLEFSLAGYKVVIPKQEEAWCIHDSGIANTKNKFDFYRNIFLDKYSKCIIDLILDEVENKELIDDAHVIEWRNYFVYELKDKLTVEKIEGHLINKYNLEGTQDNELFNFDRIKALEILNKNKETFYKYLNQAKLSLVDKNYEQASRWCFEGARFASENHPGFYTSNELENILIECANNISTFNEYNNIRKNTGNKRKILHVLSEGYSVGGHTRLVKNWIEKDFESEHSLVTTWQIKTTPSWLLDKIKDSGGWTYSLEGIQNFTDRSLKLRELAYEWADVVILHIHMYDPIPIMAFGIQGGPPILFMNHADHLFWVGSSIIDRLIDFRLSGRDISIRRRNILRNILLPLPLSLHNNLARDKGNLRKCIGINEDAIILLTIASKIKFNTINSIHYLDILKKIVMDNENVIAIIIGPENEDEWLQAYEFTKGRILPLGTKEDVEKYYCISDIYVDSFMLGSVTSALVGGLYGLPIVSLQNHHNLTLSSLNEFSYNKDTNNVNSFIYSINKLIKDKSLRESEGNKILHQIKVEHVYKWSRYLNEMYMNVENYNHTIYNKTKFQDEPREEDLFLALFQSMKP